MNEPSRPKLEDLASESWRIQIDDAEAEANIVMIDKDRRGAFIGPLATVPAGCTELVVGEGGDGDYVTNLMDDADGRNLYAVAALPQFARLVCWIENELEKLGGIHFAASSKEGRFHRELKNRCEWIKQLVDERERTMDNGTHLLMSFDEAVEPKMRAM